MGNKYSIRPATPEDEAAVSQLLQASYPVLMKAAYEEAVLAKALPLMTKANPVLLESGTFYLAETADGQIIGCGGWTKERPGSGEVVEDLAHIRHFAVHPDWTRHGVGRALFACCRDAAKKEGVERFECYASLNAEPFYRSVGLERLEPFEVPMGDGVAFLSIRMAGRA